METAIMGYIGVVLGRFWDNGKENGTFSEWNVLGAVPEQA